MCAAGDGRRARVSEPAATSQPCPAGRAIEQQRLLSLDRQLARHGCGALAVRLEEMGRGWERTAKAGGCNDWVHAWSIRRDAIAGL